MNAPVTVQTPIYLDYLSTTPVDPRVVAVMSSCLSNEGVFGNPASRSHVFGWKAEEAVENARNQVAELINADPREIVWTSGATESDNLAIKGAVAGRTGVHVVTSRIEHKAVVDTCKWLEGQGVEVTWLAPDADGRIPVERVLAALREHTVLVSLMMVNNELGCITDIAAIATSISPPAMATRRHRTPTGPKPVRKGPPDRDAFSPRPCTLCGAGSALDMGRLSSLGGGILSPRSSPAPLSADAA